MATKPAKKKGSKKAAPAKKKTTKKKESPERATFREQLESSARYHLEKWNQKMGMSLKKVKQAEDSELIDELLTKFDDGEIALNDLAPKGGKKQKASDPDDDNIDELLEDELEGGDDDEDGEDSDDSGEEEDDIDALLDDELSDDDGEETEEEEAEEESGEDEYEDEDLGKSAIEDKLDQLISQNTKIADRLDKTSGLLTTALEILIGINATAVENFAFLRIYTKAALKINKVKEGVFDKIVKKSKAVAKKEIAGKKEDE